MLLTKEIVDMLQILYCYIYMQWSVVPLSLIEAVMRGVVLLGMNEQRPSHVVLRLLILMVYF